MKDKKNIIIVLSIVGIYLVLAIVLFGWDNFINKFQGLQIVLKSGDKWQLKNGKWSDIEKDKDYNWKKFDVYINNQLLGNYSLVYNDKWYLYDKNRKSQKYDGDLIALRGNKKYTIIDFKAEELNTSDENILKDILKEENINYPEVFSIAKKVSLDLDNDGEIESIYTISNAFVEEEVNTRFSIIFIKDNDIQIIYKKVDKIIYNLCTPKISHIIDVGNDSKYEIITECNYYSLSGTCNNLYELKDGQYKIVKSC